MEWNRLLAHIPSLQASHRDPGQSATTRAGKRSPPRPPSLIQIKASPSWLRNWSSTSCTNSENEEAKTLHPPPQATGTRLGCWAPGSGGRCSSWTDLDLNREDSCPSHSGVAPPAPPATTRDCAPALAAI